MVTLIERPHKFSYSKNDIRYVFELDDLTRTGLFLQVTLFYTKPGMTGYEDIMTFNLKPDQNGLVHLYVQAYLDSTLNYVVPELGQLFTEANDQLSAFYIYYREIDDDNTDSGWTIDEETEIPARMAIKGGIEKHKFSRNNFFLNYWEPSGAFLTWQPSGKFIYDDENAYLTFINENFDTDGYVLRVRTVDTAGLINISYINLPSTNAGIAHVKVDPQALNLAAHVIGQLHYYQVSIHPDALSPAITTTHTFYIQYRPHYYYYDFIYHNSLGGIDTIRVKGDVAESFERKFTEINSGFNLNDWTDQVKIHETRYGSLQIRRKYKGDIGYQRSKAEQSSLVELLLSPGIYQIIGNRFVPVLTLQKEQDLGLNPDLKKSFPIEWSLSEENEVYTPIEMTFGDGDIITEGGGDPPPCDAMTTEDFFGLPNATLDVPYLYELPILTGTAPITATWSDIPAWMSINVIDNNLIRISGTPNAAADDLAISFTITNCGGSITFDTFLTIEDPAPPEFNVLWSYFNGVGLGGSFKIIVNGTVVVSTTATFSSGLTLTTGDVVEVIVMTDHGTNAQTHITGSYDNDTSEEHITTDGFTFVAGGSYTIVGES